MGAGRHGPGVSRRVVGWVLLAMALTAMPAAARDASVAAAQRVLKGIGYDVGVPDGIVGQRTHDALTDFQRTSGLPITGELDAATKEALAKLDPALAARSAVSAPKQLNSSTTAHQQSISTLISPVPSTPVAPASHATAPTHGNSESSTNPIGWIIVVGGAIWFLLARRKRRSNSVASGSSVPAPIAEAAARNSGNASLRQASEATFSKHVQWICSDETITVAGHTIQGGFLYVGQSRSSGTTGEDNCLLDPSLPVAKTAPDTTGVTVPYYPSYQRISPQARLAYLLWLSSGRRDPNANIGYVFLYFYGLERRLIVDRSKAEAPAIIAELERLLAIYGPNNSFARYVGDLLGAARLLNDEDSFADHPPAVSGTSWEVPIALRVALGRRIGAGKSLTAEWMLAWLHADPETRLRTPARRAATEFRALFSVRFASKHPDGLKIKSPKTRLKPTYRMASAYQQVQLPIGDMPDVTTIQGPLNEARAIADTCMDELDSYSRFLARHPDKAGGLEAMLLLPPEIRASAAGNASHQAAGWAKAAMGVGDIAIVSGKEALAQFGFDAASKPSRRDAARLSEMARMLGLGLEPDPAFGSGVITPDESAALFRLPPDSAATPSVAYAGMWLLVGLGASVALASGGMHPEEQHLLVRRIEAANHLPTSERVRLRAHVQRFERRPANLSSFKEKIAALPEAERREIARFAASMAAADGQIDPAEVRTLERIYVLLEFDKTLVFSDLHAGAAAPSDTDEPVPVASADSTPPGHRIPPAAVPADPHAVTLDAGRLQRIIADTSRVSAVLGAVFEEQPAAEPEQPPVEDERESADQLAGLDHHHRALVEALLSRPEWPRADFGRLTRSMDLLPDGALETVNEWALERFDDVLVEDGDPLIVNQNLIPPGTREAA